MLQLNQVYYRRYKSRIPKHYNYVQRQLKQKVFTKITKMPSRKASVQRPSGLIKSVGKHKCFKGDYTDLGR